MNRLSVDKARDLLRYEILPIDFGTFFVKIKVFIKFNTSLESILNADSDYV